MRRSIGEWLLSAGAIALFLLALLVIYDPVRDDAKRVMSKPSAELSSVVHKVRSQSRLIASRVREQTRAHTEIVVFGIAATVLVGFMLRT